MDLAGEKKRSDYLDKKQPEEAKTGNGKDKGKSQDAVTGTSVFITPS